MFIDYYAQLGISPKATQEEIKTAYRELAFQYHPDRNPEDNDAHKRFLEISEAYKVLSDPKERKKFHHRYLTKTAPTKKTEITSYDLTRAKRSSRYGRGRYNQRVRYRGTVYQGPVSKKGPNGPRKSSRQQEDNQGIAHDIFSDKYREEMAFRAREMELGYSWYARVMQAVAVAAIIFCVGLLFDYYLPRQVEQSIVLNQYNVPWSFSAPGLVTVSTENCRFTVGRIYADYVPAGKEITIERTSFSRTPVRVTTYWQTRERDITTSDGIFGSLSFYLIFVVILLGGATLYFREYTTMASYAGTAIILLGLVILSSL